MLNERIKTQRLAHGLNQVMLASHIGVSKQCVSNWENGYIQPSIEMLVKLADLFAVSTDYLLGRTDEHLISIKGLTAAQVYHIKAIINDITGENPPDTISD